ncbi:MAG TPA: hypothetical protein VFV27_12270 [Nevskiaceae bacterium]|nr:hypothetical protein [Nevskiaceae bacterium]
MRYLQILVGAIAALAATLAMVCAVVMVLYAFHLDAAPNVRREIPTLATLVAGLALIAASGGLSFFALLRQRPWRWPALAGFAAVLVPVSVGLVLTLS